MNWSWRSKKNLLINAILGLIGFFLRYLALSQTPYPNGWDGYYYVMQVHSLITYGHMQSLDYSLVYPYFLFTTYLIGDFILAYKIGAALLSSGICVALYICVSNLCHRPWAPILCVAYFLFSPTMTYFISQFPKNAMGLIFFFLFLNSVTLIDWKRGVLFAALAFLTHRMMGGLILVVLPLLWLRNLSWKWIGFGCTILILLSLLPGILHVSDLKRFQGAFSMFPQFAPLSFLELFKNELSPYWVFELFLIAAALVWIIFWYFRDRIYESSNVMDKTILPALVVISLFPFFQMSNGSMGFRFFLVAPFFLSTLLVIKMRMPTRIAYLVCAILLVASLFSYKSYDPAKHDPPNKVYEIIVKRLQLEFQPDDYPLVISHKSLAEMIIYKTDFDALNWTPPSSIDKGETLRIVHNIQYFHFTKYLSREELKTLKKLTLHYYIMTEKTWDSFVSRVISQEDSKLLSMIREGNNPIEERPDYLRKGPVL